MFKGNLNKASYTATWERSLLVETTSLRKGTTKGKKAPSNTRATVLYLQEKSISNLENYKPKYCLHINITEKIASKECYVHLQTICIYIYIYTYSKCFKFISKKSPCTLWVDWTDCIDTCEVTRSVLRQLLLRPVDEVATIAMADGWRICR